MQQEINQSKKYNNSHVEPPTLREREAQSSVCHCREHNPCEKYKITPLQPGILPKGNLL